MRPNGADELLHLSRRTKLILRIPKDRLEDASSLQGAKLDVHGNALEVLKFEQRHLQPMETLLAHFVVHHEAVDEQDFRIEHHRSCYRQQAALQPGHVGWQLLIINARGHYR